MTSSFRLVAESDGSAKRFVARRGISFAKRNGQGYKACKPKLFDLSPMRNENTGRS